MVHGKAFHIIPWHPLSSFIKSTKYHTVGTVLKSVEKVIYRRSRYKPINLLLDHHLILLVLAGTLLLISKWSNIVAGLPDSSPTDSATHKVLLTCYNTWTGAVLKMGVQILDLSWCIRKRKSSHFEKRQISYILEAITTHVLLAFHYPS